MAVSQFRSGASEASFSERPESTDRMSGSGAVSRAAGDNVLRVYPRSVEFHGVQVGPIYVLQLIIQNADTVARRVRVAPTQSKAFRVHMIPQGAIAPGLDVKVDVEFHADEDRDYHDKLYISSGKNVVEVPLHAYAPAPKLVFPSLVDLGVTVRGSLASKTVTLSNQGHRAANWRITGFEHLPLAVAPSHGVLKPADGQQAAHRWAG